MQEKDRAPGALKGAALTRPLDTQDIDLQINSSVEKQFGDAIRTTILDVLARYNVRGVQLNVDDKGALDCILRARLEALMVSLPLCISPRSRVAYQPSSLTSETSCPLRQ